MKASTDYAAADWVVAGTKPLRTFAAAFVPVPFPAYARVLHSVADADGSSWASQSAVSGRPLDSFTQWRDLVAPEEEFSTPAPRRGSLTIAEATSIAAILALHTSTPGNCYFGIWEGWGGIPASPSATFESSTRGMRLWEGSIADAARSFEAAPSERVANLWWPRDRAWFVVTEIDFDSTIVAGTRECIDALTQSPGVEAFTIPGDLDLSSTL